MIFFIGLHKRESVIALEWPSFYRPADVSGFPHWPGTTQPVAWARDCDQISTNHV